MVRACGTQARLAHRILLGALCRVGQALPRHAAGRAAGDAAVRALLADPLLQGRRNERRARGHVGGARRRGLTGPHSPHAMHLARRSTRACHIGFIESPLHRHTTTTRRAVMQPFLEALRVQRWDDHRFYHHSRVNQSLHLVSAISFLSAYVMMFQDPAIAALIGWLVAMTSRQIGHFFFEPRDYDVVNQATHEYKEEIKVGYNLRRKVVLMTIWALSPLPLYFDPTFFGVFTPHASIMEFVRHVAQIWLVIGVGGLLFRTVQLFFIKDVQTGLVWATKILTDPFHDIKLYYKAPLSLLRGEWIDPHHAQGDEWLADDAAEAPHAT